MRRSLRLSDEFSSRSLAHSDNLTCEVSLAVTGIGDDFLAPDIVILLHEFTFVDNLLLKEAGISRIKDIDLAHHLTHNHLEVLVVDLNTLHAVYVLNLVHDIFLNGSRAFDIEDVTRSDCTV